MNIFKKAAEKAKSFIKTVKKETKKYKRDFVKGFKRKYTGKKTKESLRAGSLVAFRYSAIDQTHTFDKAPFIVSLGAPRDNPKHILGLNINWIKNEDQRVLLASLIVELLEKNNGKLSYDVIKPLIKKFEGSPVLRRYAIRRISGKVIKMPPSIYLRAATFIGPDFSKGD